MFGFKKKAKAQQYWLSPIDSRYWIQAEEILSSAHILIAGRTGCGKSTMMHSLLWTALVKTPAKVKFIFIDMKRGIEMQRYAQLPHTIGFAINEEEAITALDKAISIMQNRLDEMRSKGETMFAGADVYVVIDELGFLLQSCGQDALKRLTLISQQGRAARVHLLMATQNPSKKGIPAAIQQNMTCMVGLSCKSDIESRQIIGKSGCEFLPKHGEGIMLTDDWQRIAIYMTPDADIKDRIAWWMDKSKCVVDKLPAGVAAN